MIPGVGYRLKKNRFCLFLHRVGVAALPLCGSVSPADMGRGVRESVRAARVCSEPAGVPQDGCGFPKMETLPIPLKGGLDFSLQPGLLSPGKGGWALSAATARVLHSGCVWECQCLCTLGLLLPAGRSQPRWQQALQI